MVQLIAVAFIFNFIGSGSLIIVSGFLPVDLPILLISLFLSHIIFLYSRIPWICITQGVWNISLCNSITSWWRHQMETFYALLALCLGISPVTGEFPSQRPVTWSFDIFFMICVLNKWFSKQSWGWWFETPTCTLWRHYNDYGVSVQHLKNAQS